MKKRLVEVAFIAAVIFIGIFGLSVMMSVDRAPFVSWGVGGVVSFLFPIMIIVGLGVFQVAQTGYAIGVARGRGRMLRPNDLIPNKSFKIDFMGVLSDKMTFVAIAVEGHSRLFLYPSEVPSTATHVRSSDDDFEFLEIDSNGLEILVHS